MSCPPDIAEVLLEILYHGMLRIRGFASCNQVKKCFLEADYLHNLPGVLSDYREQGLQYYWNVERPLFMERMPEADRRDLASLWEQLESLMKQHGVSQSADVIPDAR